MEDIHIVRCNGKWGVYSKGSHRSKRNFKHRDLAFHYATRYDARIIVHNTDGMVVFIYEDKNGK